LLVSEVVVAGKGGIHTALLHRDYSTRKYMSTSVGGAAVLSEKRTRTVMGAFGKRKSL
jgi:hypothetical protein